MQTVLTTLETAKTLTSPIARLAAGDHIEGEPQGLPGSDKEEGSFGQVFTDLGTGLAEETQEQDAPVQAEPEAADFEKPEDVVTDTDPDQSSIVGGEFDVEGSTDFAIGVSTSGATRVEDRQETPVVPLVALDKSRPQPNSEAEHSPTLPASVPFKAETNSEVDAKAVPSTNKEAARSNAPVARHMLENVLSVQTQTDTTTALTAAADANTAPLPGERALPITARGRDGVAEVPRARTVLQTPENTSAQNKVRDTTIASPRIQTAHSQTSSEPALNFDIQRGNERRQDAVLLHSETPETGTKPQTSPAVMQAPIQTPQPFAIEKMELIADRDALARLNGDPSDVIHWEPRLTQSNASGPQATVTINRTDLPPNIASQIAAALHKAPDKPIEIALNPPELGRVRMVLSASEAGMVVQVLTDRADTLDLMRRNIDDLGRALSDLGYENLSFAFGQGGEDSGQRGNAEGDAVHLHIDDVPLAADIPARAAAPALAISSDSVDIRI